MRKDHYWLNKETYDHVSQIIADWLQWKKDIYKDLIENRNATADDWKQVGNDMKGYITEKKQ